MSAGPKPRGGRSRAQAVGRIEVVRFPSRTLENTRSIRVLLPPDYDARAQRARRYPVLYLNDGQNLFDRETAFGGVEWQVDETVASLLGAGEIAPLIVVGIDHGGRRRLREFVPWPTAQPPVRRPLGTRYAPFLVTELMPFVNARFRTRTGAGNTGLGGSSLGAAIALHAATVMPGTFGRLLLESPSLFLAERRLLAEAAACRRWPKRIALAVGTREAGDAEVSARMVADVLELERILRRQGLGADRLRVQVEEDASHGEAAWARRLPDLLRFLYGTERTPARAAA